MRLIYRAGSYLEVFLLGGYAAAEFRYDDHIETWKWIFLSLIVLVTIVLSHKEQDK